MAELSKSQKIRISLTIIWGIITALFAGGAAQDYSSFNFLTFLGVLVFLNLPTLLYWLGFWIWGDGYLFNAISWPFKKIFTNKKEGQEASIARKILAGFLAVLAFMLVAVLINVAEEAPKYIFLSFSERALRNVEALAAIMVLIIAVLAAGKTYRFVVGKKAEPTESKDNLPEIKLSKKHKIVSLIISATSIVLALMVVFIASNEQRISAAYLFGETVGAFILLGVLAMLFTPKKWMKAYQTPVLSVVFFAASIFICYPQYMEAKDARNAALSVADAIEQEYISSLTAEDEEDIKLSKIELPSSNKMAPFMDWVNRTRQRAADILLDYANSFPADFEEILSPDKLSDIASIRKSKESVLKVINTIPDYKRRSKAHFEAIETELQSLNVNEELKSGALEGFQKQRRQHCIF